ncbi:MAG: glycine--tRNA ligase subunit beta [bacterium]|nr:glycine--tRNA ligase subunit beta [bacterium]
MPVEDLVFEIGTEEIPSRLLGEALVQLAEVAARRLAEARLGHGALRAVGTPRRLALLVDGVAPAQEDLLTEVKGPPVRAAFDGEGKPTPAAEGFARGQGLAVSELVARDNYVYAVRREPGRPAREVLARLLPDIVTGLEFARPMRWGTGETKFVRPIRWLLTLLGDQVVEFEFAGLASSRWTGGHRFLGPGPHEVDSARDYLAVMRRARVIVDPEARRDQVREQVEKAGREANGVVFWVPGLLDEVAGLVEYPTALTGRFDAGYLELPRELLVTVMRHHQRCFPVEDRAGRLLPAFVAVRCGDGRGRERVVRGNEGVLRARLADARFFFREDLQTPLESLLPRLDEMVFAEGLGTMGDRVARIVALTGYLAHELELGERETAVAVRAAQLAKADLATRMVYEYPELEGVMGGEYALRSGEDAEVAQAIREHYLPRTATGDLPASVPGAVVGLADRLDALVAFFGSGVEATGSQDPLGQRRLGAGAIRLLTASLPGLPLRRAIARAGEAQRLPAGEHEARLLDFLLVRFKSLLAEEGFRPDVVEAVLAAGVDPLDQALARIRALTRFQSSPLSVDLTAAHTRVSGLARRAPAGREVNPATFTERVERDLHRAFVNARQGALPLLERGAYEDFWSCLARLRGPVDAFFDGVMVMVDDAGLRDNRLALLRDIAGLMTTAADLGRLAGDG